MTYLSPAVTMAAGLWAIVATVLFVGWQRFANALENDLRRAPPLGEAPASRWYHTLPAPPVLVALGEAALAVAGVVLLKRDPTMFPRALEQVSTLVARANDVDPGWLVIVPSSMLWALLVVMVAIWTSMPLASLVVTELLGQLAPSYVEHSFGTVLGRAKKAFDREWERERGADVRQRLLSLLALGAMAIALLSMQMNSAPIALLAASAGMAAVVVIICRRVAESHVKVVEIRKRFDAARLTQQHRRTLWSSALKAWLIVPVGLAAASFMTPLYTFDARGMVEHCRRQQRLIPWSAVVAVDIVLRADTSGARGPAGPHRPEPHYEVALRTQDEWIAFNQLNALTEDPVLTRRFFELLRVQQITVRCSAEPGAKDQLQDHLMAADGRATEGSKQSLRFLRETCGTLGA